MASIVQAQAHDAKVWHLRTQGGRREVDLIVEPKLCQVVALEVKLSATVDDHDTRHPRRTSRSLRIKLSPEVAGILALTAADIFR